MDKKFERLVVRPNDGKISIRDDYITQERENIQLLTEKAKAQFLENPDKCCVRKHNAHP